MSNHPVSSNILVYYCSGHGYGHATRVSALARHFLSLEPTVRPVVNIVSSAPRHVFADSIACGAFYRFAVIDPVIVQPLAYRVDRKKSVEVLKAFLKQKDELLEREKAWLLEIGANAVLSDAAFLGCLAGKAAGIPSILVTNFSFDSVFSYLSTAILDSHSSTPAHELHPDTGRETGVLDALVPDTPIPWMELEPLVSQIHSGYRCADLLVLLPGYIPMPSFFESPSLPASSWIDAQTLRIDSRITQALSTNLRNPALLPPIPFPEGQTIPRKVIAAPLLVRTPQTESQVCSPEGRSRFLRLLGVPEDRHGPDTKILIVSFGGQNFHQPSRQGSRTHSRNASRDAQSMPEPLQAKAVNQVQSLADINGHPPEPTKPRTPPELDLRAAKRLVTESHIWVPGAPPALKSSGAGIGTLSPLPKIPMTPMVFPPTPSPSPGIHKAYFDVDGPEQVYMEEPRLLPDDSWIAIVCGVTKEQWLNPGEDIPDGFYVAPRDVYMPDLTLLADVLLGKLGYGTVSECVDACTPFVYVSRPLFVEEHGLRLLLEKDGVGIELLRECYEAGDWATAIAEAYERGKPLKERKRSDMVRGANLDKRDVEGRELATSVLNWINEATEVLKRSDGSPELSTPL